MTAPPSTPDAQEPLDAAPDAEAERERQAAEAQAEWERLKTLAPSRIPRARSGVDLGRTWSRRRR